MSARKHPAHPLFIIFAVMLMASLINGCNTAVQPQPGSNGEQGQSKPTKLSQETSARAPTRTRAPTNTRKPVNTPGSGAAPTALPEVGLPAGLSRSNPTPRSGVASVPNWDIQVLEVKRGEEAWKDMQAASEFNEEAPEGMEYLIVKLHVKSTYADGDEHSLGSCDFSVTGDQFINYSCGAASEFEPILDATLASGAEAEGWVTYLVGKGEKDLILVFQEIFSLEENAMRYIALDKGASISMPADLATIQPTDLGTAQNDPAPRTEKVATGDWELFVSDVVRGEDAWAMVQDANAYNGAPVEGMEYIAVKIHVRYIGKVDQAESIDRSSFQTVGSLGVFHDSPAVAGPEPSLDISLFPGGEYEGWVVLQAASGETGVVLVFKPVLDESDANQRYISLEP
jgi:hypothetical protein